MVCKNCGKEIPDGAMYCEACGAPLEEPVVLKVTKEDIKRAEKEDKRKAKEKIKLAAKTAEKPQPTKKQHRKPADLNKWIDVEGYFKSVGADRNLLFSFVGAIALYLAPFMNWIWEKLFDVKRKANLFELGMKSSMVEDDGTIIATGATIVMVLAILGILIGIWMLLLSGAEYIKPLRKYAENPIMRFLPIVLMLLIFIIVMNNKEYVQSMNVLQKNLELAEALGTTDNYSVGRGLGPVFYCVGLACYTIGTVGDMLERRQKKS